MLSGLERQCLLQLSLGFLLVAHAWISFSLFTSWHQTNLLFHNKKHVLNFYCCFNILHVPLPKSFLIICYLRSIYDPEMLYATNISWDKLRLHLYFFDLFMSPHKFTAIKELPVFYLRLFEVLDRLTVSTELFFLQLVLFLQLIIHYNIFWKLHTLFDLLMDLLILTCSLIIR